MLEDNQLQYVCRNCGKSENKETGGLCVYTNETTNEMQMIYK